MRCYNQTESLLYSKYIFSVLTTYTMDFSNFNMDTHVKGITNEASAHSLESVHIKAPSTPEETLFSMEEAQTCVSIVSLGSATATEWWHFRIIAHACYSWRHCTHTGGTNPHPDNADISLHQLIVRHSSAINHSVSSVTYTAWSTPVIPIWNLLGAISIDELGKKKKNHNWYVNIFFCIKQLFSKLLCHVVKQTKFPFNNQHQMLV